LYRVALNPPGSYANTRRFSSILRWFARAWSFGFGTGSRQFLLPGCAENSPPCWARLLPGTILASPPSFFFGDDGKRPFSLYYDPTRCDRDSYMVSGVRGGPPFPVRVLFTSIFPRSPYTLFFFSPWWTLFVFPKFPLSLVFRTGAPPLSGVFPSSNPPPQSPRIAFRHSSLRFLSLLFLGPLDVDDFSFFFFPSLLLRQVLWRDVSFLFFPPLWVPFFVGPFLVPFTVLSWLFVAFAPSVSDRAFFLFLRPIGVGPPLASVRSGSPSFFSHVHGSRHPSLTTPSHLLAGRGSNSRQLFCNPSFVVGGPPR